MNEDPEARHEISKLQQAIGEAAEQKLKDEIVESAIRVTAAAYEHAGNYTNVVIIGGYAAYFALLSAVKDDISSETLIWSALWMMVSVTAFVSFEVYKMLYISFLLHKRSDIFKHDNPIKIDKAYQAMVRKAQAIFVRFWILILLVCIPSVVIGIGLLFYTFVSELLK